jgi:hypothetical protein
MKERVKRHIRVYKSEQGYHFAYRLKEEKAYNKYRKYPHALNQKENYLIQQAVEGEGI